MANSDVAVRGAGADLEVTTTAIVEPAAALPAKPEKTDADKILATLTALGRRKEVDAAQLQAMLDVYDRIVARQAQADFAIAFAELQAELPVISERGEIHDKNGKRVAKYAYFEDIMDQVTPRAAKHGFVISFHPRREGDEQIVKAEITHVGGVSKSAEVSFPFDAGPMRNAVQARGSSISYAKRYAITALLNITSRGEDDDGSEAGAVVINNERRQTLLNIIEQIGEITGKNEAEIFCSWANVNSVADVLAQHYERCHQALLTKLREARTRQQGLPQ